MPERPDSEEIKNDIDANITNETSPASITPTDVGDPMKRAVEFSEWNEANTVENFLDKTSIDSQIVAGQVEFLQDITVPTGSVVLGKDGARISSLTRSLGFTNARREVKAVVHFAIEENGTSKPYYYEFGATQTFPVTDGTGTTLTGDQDFGFTSGADALSIAFLILPKSSGTLRVESWDGADDTGAKIADNTFEVPAFGFNMGNLFRVELPAPVITQAGDLQFTRFSGVDLEGGLVTTGNLAGQTLPYLETELQFITRKDLLSEDDEGFFTYKGNWDADTNTPTLADGGVGGVEGDFYYVSVAGNTVIDGNGEWSIGDLIYHVNGAWNKILSDVSILLKSDNIDNNSSVTGINVTEALDNLQVKPSEGAFADGDKTKLDGIEAGATADQDLSGLAAKANVLELDNTTPFTPDADHEPATKKYVDDNSGGGVTTHGALTLDDGTNPHGTTKADVGLGNVLNVDGTDMGNMVETATEKVLSDAERAKLAGLDPLAEPPQDISNLQEKPSEGAFADGDKTKLDGIEVNAAADQTGAEIKSAYEGEANTNAFTDTEKTNLSNQSGTNTGDQDLSGLALKSNVLELDNADAFTPDADYEPATKKYVDDNSSLGYILVTWGADLQNVGKHPAINSPSNSAQITSLGIMASMPVPAAGILDTITYYNNTGDNTTEFQIIKNGVVVHTFTCTGPYGAETGIGLPIGFAGSVPDNIAIRYSAGTAPWEGLYTAYVK